MTVSSLESKPAVPAKPQSRRWLVFKIILSVLVLGGALWHCRNDIPSLSSVDRWAVVEAICLLLIQPLLIGIRWWLLLRAYEMQPSVRMLTSVTWISVFANQFLPAGVGGDAVRIVYARKLGIRLAAATASVVMDRIIALVALLILIVFLAPSLPPAIDRRIVVGLAVCCGLIFAVLLYAFVYLKRRKDALSGAILQRMAGLAHFTLGTFSHPLYLLGATLLSITVHILSLMAFLALVQGLSWDGQILPLLSLTALLTFIQIIPVSIGGWGVREVAAVSLLGAIGILPGPALLASLLLGLCYAIASLPGALIWPFFKAYPAVRS